MSAIILQGINDTKPAGMMVLVTGEVFPNLSWQKIIWTQTGDGCIMLMV